jgi:signal transduction histidine kinase
MSDPALAAAADRLEHQQLTRIRARTDRLFAVLMGVQFAAGVTAALVISPRTWTGPQSTPHVHVYAAVLIGGLLASLPIALALRRPGRTLTRHVIAAAQMLFSALFIHLMGGRIETHFHVFGSLAFLAFYRDWRVLVPATLVVAIDHAVRGVFWPQSVFGVATSAPWRALEHAGWVLFEDVFLGYQCVVTAREVRLMAQREARLQAMNSLVEDQVRERTRELQAQTNALHQEVHERKALQAQLLQAQKLESIGQLASGIAHEINTPAQYVSDNTRFLQDNFAGLLGALDLLRDATDPGTPDDARAARLDAAREALARIDYDFLRAEVPLAIEQSLEGLDRVTTIVRAMKEFSHPGTKAKEPASINRAIESTVIVCRNRWKYVADLQLDLAPDLPMVPCHLADFSQVILNLVVNSADAIEQRFRGTDKQGLIVIRTRLADGMAQVRVEDNGGGIPDTIAQRVFDPFFTTKAVGKGTGQGLSIARHAIVEKHGGTLEFQTTPGEGTTFIARLPLHEPRQAKEAA